MTLINTSLTKNTVDLWVISLPLDPDLLLTLRNNLIPQELESLESFKTQPLKDNAIASRGALRAILSKYIAVEPSSIKIESNKYGKPYIQNSNISFNVSHASKYILIAVSTNINLGVDVEKIIEDFVYSDIVDNYFTNAEKQHINLYGIQAFYRAWTRKEACLKAVGKGLSIDLKDIEVTCSDRTARVINFKDYNNSWQLFEIDCDHEYMASIALQANEPYYINKLEFK